MSCRKSREGKFNKKFGSANLVLFIRLNSPEGAMDLAVEMSNVSMRCKVRGFCGVSSLM